MKKPWENILMIAGSGRNVGKTTFICQLIEEIKNLRPIAVKISPHIHDIEKGMKVIIEEKGYQVYEEINADSTKDSSRYLQSGAYRSFYIQTNDTNLKEAFIALYPYFADENPILIESGALHKHINGGNFLFIHKTGGIEKPSTQTNLKIADFVVKTDGNSFSIKPNQLKFENGWKINQP